MTKTLFATVSVACLGFVASGCGGASEAPPRTEENRPLETPARPGSSAVNLATGADGRLYLSWVEPAPAGHALRFAVWGDDKWSAPRTIAEGAEWFVNWADVPSLAALADGTLAAHWLAKSGESTYAYDVWLSVSADAGATWSRPRRAHDDGTETEHGFVSIVPARDGFDVVWLDGRAMVADPPGPMTLRHARLDRAGNVGPATIVDPRVCECCPTDATRVDDGLLLLYRDRSDNEIRDIWHSTLEDDAWSEPRAVWNDGWKTAGCPVNGPAVDAAGAAVTAAWFTMEGTRQGIVRVAFSDDGGRTFGTPTRVDEGDPIGRVDVIRLADGTARVGWMEQVGTHAAIQLRDVAPQGSSGPARTIVYTSVKRSSGYPKLAFLDGVTFVAWTEVDGETTRVRSGRLPQDPF